MRNFKNSDIIIFSSLLFRSLILPSTTLPFALFSTTSCTSTSFHSLISSLSWSRKALLSLLVTESYINIILSWKNKNSNTNLKIKPEKIKIGLKVYSLLYNCCCLMSHNILGYIQLISPLKMKILNLFLLNHDWRW